MNDFAAIDFETANNARTSVCSVGVVIVRGGVIVDKFYSRIYPYPDYFTYWTTRIHGMTMTDVEDARCLLKDKVPNHQRLVPPAELTARQGEFV